MQLGTAEARAKELQEELTGVYKEKSRLAEELVAASRQLQIVRDSNEAQARELDDLAAKGREMRARIKELSDAVEKGAAATALATAEMQVQCSFSFNSAKFHCRVSMAFCNLSWVQCLQEITFHTTLALILMRFSRGI